MYLGLYEKALPSDLSWKERLLAAKNSGFDFFEISIDESDLRLNRLEWSIKQKQELIKATQAVQFPIRTMCLSAHRKYSFGSPDKEKEIRSIDIMRKAINFACDIGIRIIQLAGYDVYYEESTQETKERFTSNLKKAVEMAAQKGVVLGFETMETPFMNNVTKAMKYVDKINSPYLQVYPDIGNVTIGANDVRTDLLNGRGRIVAAHFKETAPNIFRDMRFGEGTVDFVEAIRTLDSIGVKMFVAEFWHQQGQDYMKELKHTHSFLHEKYEQALSYGENDHE